MVSLFRDEESGPIFTIVADCSAIVAFPHVGDLGLGIHSRFAGKRVRILGVSRQAD